MKYESIEATVVGNPQFTDETCKKLKFMINTKVNPVGNTKLDILNSISCLNKDGRGIWYEIDSDKTSTILEACAAYAKVWVDDNYNN